MPHVCNMQWLTWENIWFNFILKLSKMFVFSWISNNLFPHNNVLFLTLYDQPSGQTIVNQINHSWHNANQAKVESSKCA